MIEDKAPAIVLRPLREALPPEVAERGFASLEALEGLSAKDQLEVACRNVLAVILAARSRFEQRPEDRPCFDLACDSVEQWLGQEIALIRFTRAN